MDGLEYLNSLNTRRYRCCCSRFHVKKGALIVGTVELLWTAAILFTFIAAFALQTEKSKPQLNSVVFAAGLTVGIVYAAAVVLMFVAVKKLRPMYVLPHIVLQCMTVVSIAVLIGLCIAVLALGYAFIGMDDPEAKDPSKQEVVVIITLIICCIMLAFEIWFLNVVYKCYRYLKAKQRYENMFKLTGALLNDSKPYSPTDPALPWIDDI